MQNFKFVVTAVIVLVIIGILGYWAVATIEPGNVHVEREKQKQLEEQNTALQKEVEDLKNQVAELQPATPLVEEPTTEEPSTPTAPASSKYQSLVAELQKLTDDKIYMKEKSRGTRVGTVQTFLNIYNNTTKRVDNDYGAGTKTDVANFQKAVGLPADGQTGPATYLQMIGWLNKNS